MIRFYLDHFLKMFKRRFIFLTGIIHHPKPVMHQMRFRVHVYRPLKCVLRGIEILRPILSLPFLKQYIQLRLRLCQADFSRRQGDDGYKADRDKLQVHRDSILETQGIAFLTGWLLQGDYPSPFVIIKSVLLTTCPPVAGSVSLTVRV
jgi:hypothetical protein